MNLFTLLHLTFAMHPGMVAPWFLNTLAYAGTKTIAGRK
jgi:hypothetical protein